jgi:DNA-binding MarR family transcriptional regulator
MSDVSSPAESHKRRQWISFIQSLNPDTDAEAVRLMDELRRVSHQLHQIVEDSLGAAGLSSAKYRLLMGLLFSEEFEDRAKLNPSEISAREGTSRNTISSLIRDLEEDGLIERQPDRNDRRKINISLTHAGRDIVRNHASQHLGIIALCFDVLDAVEREKLSDLLIKLNQSICKGMQNRVRD